jgi:hypothetical protein
LLLDDSLIVCREVGFYLFRVIVSICKCIMNVRRAQMWILLQNFLNRHSWAITGQDYTNADPDSRNSRLSTASTWIFLDIAIIQLCHA